MQMVQNPWGVTVHGVASVQAMPDLARISFKVSRVNEDAGKSFAAASTAVSEVRATLREHRVPDADVERSRLSLASA